MIRLKALRAMCVLWAVALLASACSGGSGGGEANDASSLETGVKAPPVPKSLFRSTTTTDASPATSGATPTTTVPTTPAYWVSPTGDDNAAGTKNAPWKSLNAAVTKLKSGDTLYVMAGRFTETNSDAAVGIANVNGTADKWITIAAAPDSQPKVVGGEWKTIAIQSSSYLEIRGLEIVGTALVDKKPTSGIEARDSHHLRITGNYVHDGGGNGIAAINSNHVDVVDNYVSGMAKWNPYQTSGISMFESKDIGGVADADGYSARIIGNVVYGTENIALPLDGSKVVTDGNCIIIDTQDSTRYTGKTYIANNVCSNNGGRGVHVFQSGNVVAVNNTLYHNMQTAKLTDVGGELSAVAAHDVVFRNNLVIARTDRKSVHMVQDKTVTFDANIYQKASGSGQGSTDQVVTDAKVADPAQGNFTLLLGSPAIHAGNPVGAPTTDQHGNPRPAQPDVGALQTTN
jgi:parallel beta-helix repeat protein